MACQLLCVHPQNQSGDNGFFNSDLAADQTIKIWHAKNGKYEQTLEGHMAGISDIDWAPDSLTLVSGSDDKTIRLWDVGTVRGILLVRTLLGS